jgi:hypothetical protein
MRHIEALFEHLRRWIARYKAAPELRGQGQRLFGSARDQRAEAHFTRQVSQDAGECLVVLDN